MTDLTQYSGTWTIDPAHTRLGFVARHAMVTKVRGSFNEFSASMTLDGANPSASKATLTAQMASIDSGNADRDAHLKSGDFFDVDAYPTMSFATNEPGTSSQTCSASAVRLTRSNSRFGGFANNIMSEIIS